MRTWCGEWAEGHKRERMERDVNRKGEIRKVVEKKRSACRCLWAGEPVRAGSAAGRAAGREGRHSAS